MYYAKVNWYNVCTEEDEIEHILIIAPDWNAAMQEISINFEVINSIEMKIITDQSNIVYVTEDMVDDIMEMNSY